MAQDYHTETLYAAVDRFRARARRAQDESPQTYSPLTSNVPGPGFVPLSTLHATGQDGPLRVGIVWDNVNTGAKDGNTQRQCVTIGQSITVSSGNPAPNQDTSYICQAADLVTQGTPRYNQMVLRTATALGYWASTLRVRPVQNPITISPDIVNNYHLTTTSVNNVDLVIVMTAEPSPDVAIAGYAKCMQVDQFARCTVGLFNWVPALLDLVNANSPTTITSELHTAIHEIVHVLGGMGPGRVGDTPFIDDTGNPRSGPNAGVYTVLQDPAYPSVTKPVMYITTPRVLNITRTQLACDTMPGFPLEDLPLGAGVHWEARLAGGELMSYGTYSTITYGEYACVRVRKPLSVCERVCVCACAESARGLKSANSLWSIIESLPVYINHRSHSLTPTHPLTHACSVGPHSGLPGGHEPIHRELLHGREDPHGSPRHQRLQRLQVHVPTGELTEHECGALYHPTAPVPGGTAVGVPGGLQCVDGSAECLVASAGCGHVLHPGHKGHGGSIAAIIVVLCGAIRAACMHEFACCTCNVFFFSSPSTALLHYCLCALHTRSSHF